MVPNKATGRAAKADSLMPEEVSLLLQQGDLSTNLLTSATYQQLAITIAGLAIVFSIGGVVAASNLLQTILGGYLILWFLIQVPSAVFVLSQRYAVFRYRLVKKLITQQDYRTEREQLVNFLEILVEKDSEKEINYKPVVLYFGAFGIIACAISLAWELANGNIGMTGYSIGGMMMIAATFYWSGRLEREMNLTSLSHLNKKDGSVEKKKEGKQLDGLLALNIGLIALVWYALQTWLIGPKNYEGASALSNVFLAVISCVLVVANQKRLKLSFDLGLKDKIAIAITLLLIIAAYFFAFIILRNDEGYGLADSVSNAILFGAALLALFQEAREILKK